MDYSHLTSYIICLYCNMKLYNEEDKNGINSSSSLGNNEIEASLGCRRPVGDNRKANIIRQYIQAYCTHALCKQTRQAICFKLILARFFFLVCYSPSFFDDCNIVFCFFDWH